MKLYPLFFKTVFSGMDPERAHHIGFDLIRLAARTPAGPLLRHLCAPDPSLRTEVMGLSFPSPFGLAAGFDKQGAGLLALGNLGFGHIEVGTVTAVGQPGNPQPRLFRLEKDRAVINRMGFNNDGAARVVERISRALPAVGKAFGGRRPLVGINIGKTKAVELEHAVEDYRSSARTLAPVADYMVVNVSSPNTPGLRSLQSVESLEPILTAVREENRRAVQKHIPLLVKIAPDMADEDILDVAALVERIGLDGIIATNTTITREGLREDPEKVERIGAGGLSGAPLRDRSLEVLKLLRSALAPQVAVISVGGVTDADDVRERLEAGADLVQGYTAFLYEGPFWARSINRALASAR